MDRLPRLVHELDLRRLKRARTFHAILSRSEEAAMLSRPKNPLEHGHAIMDRIRALCASFDTSKRRRSYNQSRIQNRLSGSVCMLVYGADMYRYEKEIKKYNNFETIRQETATTMPRRSGKSDAIGKWLAAAMMCIPGFDGACFANSSRSAGKEKGMLGIVKDCLVKHFKILVFGLDNSECIQFTVDGDKRTFHSYPGACHTLRGVGGNVIIVEESSYVSNLAFKEIIIPLMALSTVCFIALSTLGEKVAGWFNRLIESGLVDTLVVRYVCPACMLKNITKPCIHEVDSVPHWSTEERLALMEGMYGQENTDTYLREVMGIVKDDGEGRVFQATKINEVASAPHVEFDRPVKRIFISIDPSAGSEVEDKATSDFAIVAIAEPFTTMMGMEALNIVSSAGYRETLHDFCVKLRATDYTRDAVLIFDVESGTGFTAPDVYAFVREKFCNIETMSDFERKEGTLTTNKVKQEMTEITQNILNADEIRYWKHFVSTSPIERLKREWARQMCEFKRVFVQGKTVKSHNSYVYTGKGENKKDKDDLSTSSMRALRSRYRYERDPKCRPRRWQ